jgi:uncharacterized protein YukE
MGIMREPAGFEVDTETLADAGASLKLQADDIQQRIAPWWRQVDAAQAPLDAVAAGAAWSDFTSQWSSALQRMHTAVAGYGANTSLAAVVYEHADLQASYAVPKIRVAPPPKPRPGQEVA